MVVEVIEPMAQVEISSGAPGMRAFFLFNEGNLGYNKNDFVFIYIDRIINK